MLQIVLDCILVVVVVIILGRTYYLNIFGLH